MNLLFTGAGRRNYVIEDFRQILNPTGGMVFAMNSHPLSPALDAADHAIIAPLASDPSFPGFLLDICSQNKIDAVCTLIDTDMHVLSNMRNDLMRIGTRLILPGAEAISVCRDKVRMNEWLQSIGFRIIPTYLTIQEALDAVLSNQVSFPLIIKPRMGTGSISTYRVDDEDEFRVLYQRALKETAASAVSHEIGFSLDEALMIQAFIIGKEYNLNVVNDLNGKYHGSIITEKISARSGEMDIAVTIDHPEIESLSRGIGNALKHPYLLDVDIIAQDDNFYILDMNPRISGSYPFGKMAGVQYADMLVRWLSDPDADVSSLLRPKVGVTTMKGISLHVAESA
jgi:carbamoyl-phosphate synthase large subunit